MVWRDTDPLGRGGKFLGWRRTTKNLRRGRWGVGSPPPQESTDCRTWCGGILTRSDGGELPLPAHRRAAGFHRWAARSPHPTVRAAGAGKSSAGGKKKRQDFLPF